MTRFRMGALTALIACVGAFGLAGTASAQVTPAPTAASQKVAITGTKGFKGTYTIKRFLRSGNKIVTSGTLKGTMRKNGKTKSVTKKNVLMPAAVSGAGPRDSASASQVLPPIPGACQVLNLVLGPINLNLLGLVVRTNLINVRIDAVPGDGNLLGNLLCAVTNLLNPDGVLGPLTGAVNQLTAALNAILAVLPTNPAAAAAAGSR